MNELMIHVERIVRPVGATQGRKLRMRTELLAHLQATMEEERLRFPGDEQAAIERAKLRLGDTAELTRELQQTVPTVERVLLTTQPVSRPVDVAFARHVDQKLMRGLGRQGVLTLGHASILCIVANLGYIPLLVAVYSASTRGIPAVHLPMALLGAFIGCPALLFAFYQLVFGMAAPDYRLNWTDLLKRGATIVALQSALACLFTVAIADRSATSREVVICAVSTVALLAAMTLIARRVGVLRRPYDQWLTLQIAG